MKESNFLLKFLENLRITSKRSIWKVKIHGEPMQVRGLPDVIICYLGVFVSMEFKVMRNGKLSITPYQEYTSECISNANGIHLFVWFDEDSGDVGIGSKRFSKMQEATDWLVDIMESTIRISPLQRYGDKK